MNIGEVLERAREGMAARRVFGEPYEKGAITFVPAALIRGGAGGGTDESPEEPRRDRGGAGFGLKARPVGAFVIKEGDVHWRSAADWTRIILGLQGLIALGLIVALAWPARRRGR